MLNFLIKELPYFKSLKPINNNCWTEVSNMVKFMYVYNFLILILCIFSVGNEESKSLPKPVVLASTVKVSLFGQKKILIFLFIHFVKGGSYKKNSTKKLFFFIWNRI